MNDQNQNHDSPTSNDAADQNQGPDPMINSELNNTPAPPEHAPNFWTDLVQDMHEAGPPAAASAPATIQTVAPADPEPQPEAAPVSDYATVTDLSSRRRNGVMLGAMAVAAAIVAVIVGVGALTGGSDDEGGIATIPTVPATDVDREPAPTPTTDGSAPVTVTVPGETVPGDSSSGPAENQWVELGPTLDDNSMYVGLLNFPEDIADDPDAAEDATMTLAVVSDGELVLTYPDVESCELAVTNGPQGTLAVLGRCAESYDQLWGGSTVAGGQAVTEWGAVEELDPVTLSPQPNDLYDIRWDLTENAILATAIAAEFGPDPVDVRIAESGALIPDDRSAVDGLTDRNTVWQYSYLIPNGWEVQRNDGWSTSLAATDIADGSLTIAGRFADDPDVEEIAPQFDDSATINSDTVVDLPIYNLDGTESRTVPVRVLDISYEDQSRQIAHFYELDDRRVTAWLSWGAGTFTAAEAAEVIGQVRLFDVTVTPPTECSAAQLPDPGPQDGLSPEVQATRTAVIAAARACDFDALLELAGSPDFTWSFGGGDPTWEQDERYRGDGDGPTAALVKLLSVSAGDQSGITAWPAASAVPWDAVTEPMLDDLQALGYTQADYDSFAEIGGFIGLRVGIDADGTWLYFVAGD